MEIIMANATSFVSTDRQGHFQLGHYCHITRTISISADTDVGPTSWDNHLDGSKDYGVAGGGSKVGHYDHRETEVVEKLITTVVSFSSNDPVLDAQKAEQVFALVRHHSSSTSGPGTLATLTLNREVA
jgi:hypothetical protein